MCAHIHVCMATPAHLYSDRSVCSHLPMHIEPPVGIHTHAHRLRCTTKHAHTQIDIYIYRCRARYARNTTCRRMFIYVDRPAYRYRCRDGASHTYIHRGVCICVYINIERAIAVYNDNHVVGHTDRQTVSGFEQVCGRMGAIGLTGGRAVRLCKAGGPAGGHTSRSEDIFAERAASAQTDSQTDSQAGRRIAGVHASMQQYANRHLHAHPYAYIYKCRCGCI